MVVRAGRWSNEEHDVFINGLREHGKEWKVIAALVETRTVVQIRTHAQKYFQKLSKVRGAPWGSRGVLLGRGGGPKQPGGGGKGWPAAVHLSHNASATWPRAFVSSLSAASRTRWGTFAGATPHRSTA